MSFEESTSPNYENLVRRFVSSGQWDRALSYSREWLAKEPENRFAHQAAAQALISLDRSLEAQTHVERVLAGDPQNDFAHRLMGMVHFAKGRFNQADESLRTAISLNPNDAFHWYQLGWIHFKQRDLVTAKKCAERARELNPRDADILNLLILCEPGGSEEPLQKIRRYEEALQYDPENSNLLNNIGAQHLALKDFARAEDCFRKALFFDPSAKLVRRNLFLVLKQSDRIYRLLRAPKETLLYSLNYIFGIRKKSLLLYLILIPFLWILIRFVLAGLLLWLMWVWPLTRVYEFLIIGDIRARAGELGARKGGFLGYRKWSVKLRLAIFASCLLVFWIGVPLLYIRTDFYRDPAHNDKVLGLITIVAVFGYLSYFLWSKIRNGINPLAARSRARRIDNLLNPARKKRSWWQFFRKDSTAL